MLDPLKWLACVVAATPLRRADIWPNYCVVHFCLDHLRSTALNSVLFHIPPPWPQEQSPRHLYLGNAAMKFSHLSVGLLALMSPLTAAWSKEGELPQGAMRPQKKKYHAEGCSSRPNRVASY